MDEIEISYDSETKEFKVLFEEMNPTILRLIYEMGIPKDKCAMRPCVTFGCPTTDEEEKGS